MAISNIERIGKGLAILRAGLAPYIQRELKNFHKERWLVTGVQAVLENNMGREALTGAGTPEERFARLDIQALLVILWENWNNVFKNDWALRAQLCQRTARGAQPLGAPAALRCRGYFPCPGHHVPSAGNDRQAGAGATAGIEPRDAAPALRSRYTA